MKNYRIQLLAVVANLMIGSSLMGAVAESSSEPASAPTLESQLGELALPSNRAPAAVSTERMYSVQNRLTPLARRSEFTLGGAKNFTPDDFLVSSEVRLGYNFHLSDRWSVGLSGSYVFNALSSAGERLLAYENLLPDSAFVRHRADALVTYNLFYGKFRLTMDEVFYFDQYLSLGAGYVDLNTGSSIAAVGDIGLALWLGRGTSVRLGVKDYFYRERLALSTPMVHNVLAHLDVGVLL